MIKWPFKGKGLEARGWSTLFFFGLAFICESVSVLYWIDILEPQLVYRAKLTARALTQSYIHEINDILTKPPSTKEAAARSITHIMNKILLLKEPQEKTAFIVGLRLELDESVASIPALRTPISVGELGQDTALQASIPLYTKISRELVGIVVLEFSRPYVKNYTKEIRNSFIIAAGTLGVILISAWGSVLLFLTRLKRSEQKIREKEAQVIHSGRLVAMGEMATGIAHEINQPLAIIRIAADGLMTFFTQKFAGTMEEKAAQKIIEQVNRAAAIIDHMRAFARYDQPVSTQAINLLDPLNNAISFFNEQFRAHDILLTQSVEDNSVPVKIDPGKFEQIVVNLLSNARYAVEKKNGQTLVAYQKEIHIRLFMENEKKSVVFEIKDNGIGMQEEELKRCLEPFYTTKSVGEGTGLGLSIVHGILREYHATIHIDSTYGEGTTFRLTFKTYS